MPKSETMSGKVVVITGGNSGIGRAAAEGLARLGAHVVLACRDESKAAQAAEAITSVTAATVDTVHLDLADLASVRDAAAEILGRWDRLDALINNAGLIARERSVTRDGFETTFAVNHLGNALLTELLLDRLRASAPSRIVMVSAHIHRIARSGLDFGDLQSARRYSPWLVYARSKLANIYFADELARRLRGSGVTVNAVHPGAVATSLIRDWNPGPLGNAALALFRPLAHTPEQGADTVVWLASSAQVESVTGGYFINRKPARLSRAARDRLAAGRLWEETERMLANGRP
jgi:NAD(P)-dependent dehydrogenase (short-subunit alcohol dehydrogenase family)